MRDAPLENGSTVWRAQGTLMESQAGEADRIHALKNVLIELAA